MDTEYRIGIDLGTNSAALVAVALNKDNLATGILYHDAVLFSEPLENKQGTLTPKAQDRRIARQQRKQLQRKKRRIKRIAFLAQLLNVVPNSPLRKEHLNIDGIKIPSIIMLRAKAASEKIELNELIHVFAKMIKKRGYAGGFRVKTKDSKTGKVESGANLLTEKLNDRTLGEYILERVTNGLPARLRMDDYPDTENLYALREHLEKEFEQIWKIQSQHHSILSTSAQDPVSKETKTLKDIFYNALLFQRPLKSFTQTIGNCELETNLPRASKAHPAAQSFRIEKLLNDLRWGQKKNNNNFLSAQQKDILRTLLNQQAEVKFSGVYKAFEKANCPPEQGVKFSIDRTHKESFKGNTTNAGFKTLKLLDEWKRLSTITQTQVINFLAELTSAEQLNDTNWHLKFKKASAKVHDNSPNAFRKFAPDMVEFINKMTETGKFNRLSSMTHFDSGRAKYSVKTLEKLTAYMKEFGCSEYEAIEEIFPVKNGNSHQQESLLSPHAKTGNAVVDVALGQLRHIVNDCINKLGTPKEIIVEVARELGKGPTARNDIEKQQRKFESIRKKAKDALENHGVPATNTNILKYRLWQDQDGKCPYCNQPNIGIEQLDDGSINFEHIIPKSQSKVGRKYNEIILAHRSCNDLKGNKLPLLSPLANDQNRCSSIEEMAARLDKKKQKRKAMLLRLDDPSLVADDKTLADFSSWRLHNTAWIAKLAHQWLNSVVEKPSQVFITKGGITSMMRWKLGLETVIPELRYEEGLSVLDKDKNQIDRDTYEKWKYYYKGHPVPYKLSDQIPEIEKRIDHRHHLIDALSIALCDRGITQRATRYFQHEQEKELKRNKNLSAGKIKSMMREAAMKAIKSDAGWRQQALEGFAEENCNLHHRPDHYLNARFYKDTAYGRISEDGKLRLTIRKPLKDLADKNPEKVIKNLNNIASEQIRKIIRTEFDQRISTGESSEKALTHPPIMQALYGIEKPILRVTCYFDMGAEEARRIEFKGARQSGYKHLVSDGNAYLKAVINEHGEIDSEQSHPIALIDAINEPKKPPHNEIRFYKGDTVKHVISKKRYLIKQIKATSGGTLFLTPIMETRPVKQLSSKDGLKTISLKKLVTLTVEDRDYVRQPNPSD